MTQRHTGSTMDVHANRLDNLMRLAARYDTDRDFCAAVGINHTYLPQLKAGTKRLGSSIVRRIEIALCLEPGWMDHDHRPKRAETAPPNDLHAVSAALASLPPALRDQVARLVFELSITCPQERTHVDPLRFQEQLMLDNHDHRQASSQ